MSSNSTSVPGLPELLAGLANLRGQEKFSDLVIECSDRRFPVHKLIMCSRSEYFDTACSVDFIERSEGVIKLQEEDPDNVKRMIDYMYGLEYDVQDHTKVKSKEGATQSTGKSDSNEGPINHGLIHAHMYAMGDKYLIPALKDYSKECFRRSLSTQTGNDLANSIAEAYSNTVESDRGLRDVSIQVAVLRLGRLTSDEAFSALALHIPCFGYELLQRAVAKLRTREGLLTTFSGCRDCKGSIGNPQLYCQHMRIASVSVNL